MTFKKKFVQEAVRKETERTHRQKWDLQKEFWLAGGVFFLTPMFTRLSNQTVLVCTQFDVARPDANCQASVNKVSMFFATPLKNIYVAHTCQSPAV